ncbi:effector binding domain-containing protein [Staphylococcus canis]|uniref:AraC family transcriptional regulator n=1 Tax=Staphylococcus canis TaxID=2724942 RepID=A0ABS0TC57_9STAP|nr:effector binding domain-containing protein [Staphylococcus canis]MBI5975328.1 AraC family transcriptional regulator [Staphylococcus canis]
MDVIKKVQQSIVYIEDHLLERFDFQKLCDYIGIAPYHLEQSFTMILALTPREYWHGRRMTLAAFDLIHGNSRLIDLAKKYHYDNANSFAHDFSEYHQVSPLQAKVKKDKLKYQDRLYLKLTTTRAEPYPYRLENIGDLPLIGVSRFIPANDLDNHFTIPDFLEDLKENGLLEDMIRYNNIGPHAIFVVSSPLENGLDIFVGVPSERYPSHLENRYLDQQQYAVFNLQGEIDYATNEAWHYIETTLQLSLPFERDSIYIEMYPLDISFEDPFTKIQLCIPVTIDNY